MIYKDILTESFNFKRTRSNYYTFTVPSTNKKMFVQFTKWLPNTYEVKFGVSNSNNAFVKANSKGNEIQILKTILDIACGTGDLAIRLLKLKPNSITPKKTASKKEAV